VANLEDGLQFQSKVKSSGEVELSLVRVPTPEPGPDQIVVKVEATPINPSDLGLMLARADVATFKATGTADAPVVTGSVPERALTALAARLDKGLPIGNEGAGLVVAAGASPQAQALIGKRVGMRGGGMYAQYRVVPASLAMVLPDDATSAEGASCYVNPLTALSMVETMRLEGHKALVHTAAASNLGQMLVKICLADGVGLVNVVRSAEQVKILKDIGAEYVVDSTSPTFSADLLAAVTATGATLGFDAIGGGRLAGQILSAMEAAAVARMSEFSTYGSNEHKQVYIYGSLDLSPTELNRNYGMQWGLGGWLLTPFLTRLGAEGAARLRARVIAELKTTFASHYTKEISLREALDLATLQAYAKRATGEKYLINPTLP